ncbi:MAG: SIS domain-containing protein [Syntrophotaleaceae bacterium]
MLQERIAVSLRDHTRILEETFLGQAGHLCGFAERVVATFNQGGRLLIFGSGPMGAVADLMANLFLHRLSLERPPLPALSLSQNATFASSLARDGQENQLFARQLRITAGEQDIVLALCDQSRNEALLEGLIEASQLGCTTAVVHDKGEFAGEQPDFLFRLATDSPPRTVEATVFFGHLLGELVEKALFGI